VAPSRRRSPARSVQSPRSYRPLSDNELSSRAARQHRTSNAYRRLAVHSSGQISVRSATAYSIAPLSIIRRLQDFMFRCVTEQDVEHIDLGIIGDFHDTTCLLSRGSLLPVRWRVRFLFCHFLTLFEDTRAFLPKCQLLFQWHILDLLSYLF